MDEHPDINENRFDPNVRFSEYLGNVCEIGEVRVGTPLPLGARQRGDGVNFALFCRSGTRVWLEFYERSEDARPSRAIALDPARHRTGDVWHIWVQGVRPGQLYAYRVEGPYHPQEGHRFNPNKLLLDPCATAVTHVANWDLAPARGYDPLSPRGDLSYSEMDDAGAMPKCVFAQEHFDWEDVRPPKRPWSETVIYETHVRGSTIHHSSQVAAPGTYRGLIDKIAYFKELGITAVELMPIFEFNEREVVRIDPITGQRLANYWGYVPVAFMAPKATYCSSGGHGQQKLEFKEMVKAFHQAGIEVILDVVLNHTAEGNHLGPTLCFRGLDNAIYYMLEEKDRRFYKDYTGTGNTLNANHPVVRDFILQVLRYWTLEMHVDGFRFDLASVLGRDVHGLLVPDAPLLERIAEDPILRDVKLIAEAWDAGGAYQVGSFAERRWAEWNGRYRDDVRRFWRGDEGMVGLLASRICGSADLYQASGKGPESSINFVTCHDGFTLNDLVSYQHKHNEANGEDNRDGIDENYSDNDGIEGQTDDPIVETLRNRQIKNLILTLFVSRGVPMVLGGDEFRRTQRGNNNAYCQDNEISWYNWTLIDEHKEIYRFVRGMIDFRRKHPVLRQEAFYTADEIHWHSSRGTLPDWFDPQEKCLACMILWQAEPHLYLMFNASTEEVSFTLPALPDLRHWYLAVDTSLPTPHDLVETGAEIALGDLSTYRVGPRSSAILVAYSARTSPAPSPGRHT
jgi:isoamylase